MGILDKLKSKFTQNEQSESKPKMVRVTMSDGTVEEYDQRLMITDGINCVVCKGNFYHTSLDCENLAWEKNNSNSEIKGMTIKNAKAQKMVYCQNCSRENYLHRHGRDDEI